MRPTLFSEKFGVPGHELDSANLLDPYVDTDTPLFIDPLLIDKSGDQVLRTDGLDQFRDYFDKVVRLLAMSENEGDPAWVGATKLLSLREPAENGLGYCRAHEIDNTSEPNFGGGPVDFAFGDGCKSRVLVEMKRSSGSVISGYEKQLERYKKAARTDFAVFVVIDYGHAASKINSIKKIRERKLAQGERASEIVIVDARKKLSPSKIR